MTPDAKRALHSDRVWLSRCAPELAERHRREREEMRERHIAEMRAARQVGRQRVTVDAELVASANPLMAAWLGGGVSKALS